MRENKNSNSGFCVSSGHSAFAGLGFKGLGFSGLGFEG